MLINFLFPRYANRYGVSLFLLAMRVFVGMLFMMHGLDKAVNFNILVGNFPDPLGIGPFATLLLVVFAELFCAIFFIFGLLYRIIMIPMIIAMAVAFFGIHHSDMTQGELAFLYFVIFILMYIAGPGRFSLDALIGKSIRKAYDK
jgi:putative oxidoreductase